MKATIHCIYNGSICYIHRCYSIVVDYLVQKIIL